MSTKQEKEWTAHLSLANQNVERYRKGAAQLSFVTADGKPDVVRKIQATQKTQDFLFGKYEIVVPQENQKYTSFEFHLSADRQNSLQFTLG